MFNLIKNIGLRLEIIFEFIVNIILDSFHIFLDLLYILLLLVNICI